MVLPVTVRSCCTRVAPCVATTTPHGSKPVSQVAGRVVQRAFEIHNNQIVTTSPPFLIIRLWSGKESPRHRNKAASVARGWVRDGDGSTSNLLCGEHCSPFHRCPQLHHLVIHHSCEPSPPVSPLFHKKWWTRYTTRMSNIRVWVRLQHQTREEAIKLILPRDGSDISDVLLKVPAALNVSGYRPSELALHLALSTSNGQEAVEVVALSNRMSLEALLSADDDNELNMVVTTKEGVAALAPPVAPQASHPASAKRDGVVARPRSGSTGGAAQAPSSASSNRVGVPIPATRARSPAPVMPPPVPKPSVSSALPATSARGSSPFRRTASSVSTTSTAKVGSHPVAVRSESAQRVAPIAARGSSEVSAARGSHNVSTSSTAAPRVASALRRASPMRSTATPSASSSPRPDVRHKPANGTVPLQKPTPRVTQHSLVPSCASRPTAATQRKAVGALSTSTQAVQQQQTPPVAVSSAPPPPSLGVCGAFKPQWGNVLCAACKHSKQAHDIKQHQQQRHVQHRAGAASLETTPTRSAILRPSSDHYLDPHHDEIHSFAGGVGLSTSPTPSSSIGNRSTEMNLLDPPVVSNVSLGSPDGPLFVDRH